MIKKIFLILTFLTYFGAAQSSNIYFEAMEQFNAKNYSKAYFLLQNFFNGYELRDEVYASAKFYAAEALVNLGQLEGAMNEYDFLINNFKNTAFRDKSLFKLGSINYQLKKYERSRFYFNQLIEEFPLNEFLGSTYFWIAESYNNQSNYEDAITYYQKALDNKYTNKYVDFTIYSLAGVYEKLEDFMSAVGQYEELLSFYKESPLAPSAQIRIGICYFQLKEYDSSILELKNPAIYDLPLEKQAEALFLLANSFYKIGEYDNAVKAYLEIITKYPSLKIIRDARYTLAWCYFQQKKYNDAYNFFNSISEGTDTIAVNASFWKAETKRYAGNEKEAIKLYEEFVKKFPREEKVYDVFYLMGVASYSKNNLESAVNYLSNALKSPNEKTKTKVNILLGEIELNRKNFTNALKNYNSVKYISESEGELEFRVLFGQAVANFYQKKFDDAVSQLSDLAFRAPSFESNKVSFYLAEALFAKEKFQEALTSYNRVNTDDETIMNPAFYGKAYCYYNLKDYTNAAYAFSDFIKKYPRDPKVNDAKLRLADSYFADKNYDNSIKTYEELLKVQDKFLKKDYIIYHYALALYKANKTSKALVELKKIRDGHSRSAYFENSIFLTGWIFFQQNSFYEAILNYKNIISIAPGSKLIPRVYYSIGDCYYNLASYDSAIIYYNKVLNEYPNSMEVFDAINGIQYCYVAKGEPDKAVNLLDNFVLRNPNLTYSDQLYLKKGEVFYSQRNYEKAKQSYKDFVAYFPKSKYIADAYFWIGKCSANLNQLEEAAFNFKLVFNSYPQSSVAPNAVVELSTVLIQQKRYDEALQSLEDAEDRYKDSKRVAEFKFIRADCYQKKGNIAASYDLYDEVVTYYDGNIFADRARIELGIMELNSKRYENAQKFFLTLYTKRTDDIGAKAQYYSGVVYLEQNKITEAITAFVRVLNIFSKYDEWVVNSYLKLGDCYEKQKNIPKAIEMYNSVLVKHKNDQYGKEAQNKLKRLR